MYSSSIPVGLGGVDVLGNLTDKMKQQLEDTRRIAVSFDKVIQEYKNKQTSKSEFVHKLVTYSISLSALNFLVMHVILELRTAIDKGTSVKDTTGGTVLPDTSSSDTSSGSQGRFGIEGFVGGPYPGVDRSEYQNIDRVGGKGHGNDKEIEETPLVDKCTSCGSTVLRKAKFCGNCGTRQRVESHR